MKKSKETHKEYKKNNSFINKYYWNGIKYPSKTEDCKNFEKSNPTIAL